MRHSVSIGLVLALLTGLVVWFSGKPGSATTIESQPRPYDMGVLLEMEPHGVFDPDIHFRNELAVIFYFSELSCNTCTTRELENMADWHARYGEEVDFFLVVHGQDPTYLNRLRRVGRVDYPILLENRVGDAGFADTAIAVIHKDRGELLAVYHPQPDPDTAGDIHLLERVLEDAITKRSTGERRASRSPSRKIWRN